ncbi:MAG: hypothetical protein WC027_02955 [Candidatus Paceibacterota bacterium]
MALHYKIVKAPSKWELSVAFFDGNSSNRRTVNFTITGDGFPAAGREASVVINQLSWEDGSGESWCFEGYTKQAVPGFKSHLVKGWFRTSNRLGWMIEYNG